MTDDPIKKVMSGLSPEAARALHAVAEMKHRSPEDVLREELREYIAAKLPLPPVEPLIATMASRFYELGYLCGTAKRFIKKLNRND